MEWKLKDQAFIRNLYREMVDEAVKKKDRSITISYYDDSVTMTVMPLIEEKSTKESEWKQYCENDINITKQLKQALNSVYGSRSSVYWQDVSVLLDSSIVLAYDGHTQVDFAYCVLTRNKQFWFCARNDEPLYFTPKYWTSLPKLPKEVE